ncbi:MAG: 30S ribosomal protein S20, partial [Anaerococcus sp.]|nr:30S ribosomal protein S20 [Anaerococcus sp.]
MANIKSAIKRIDVTRKQTARNKSAKSEIKTYVKKFEEAIANNDSEKANELFKTVDKIITNSDKSEVLLVDVHDQLDQVLDLNIFNL